MIKTNSLRVMLSSAVVFCAAAFCVYPEISFENPLLNGENKLLFVVNHNVNGSPSYKTGLVSDASTLSGTKLLTCYPEKMEMLSKGAVLQIRNKWGTARWSVADSSLSWVTRTESIPSLSERQLPQSVSPDGKWICYIKMTAVAQGELILKNASTLQETVLNKKCDISFEKCPVRWNPDSSSLLYEKNGTVYFCDPKAAFQKVQLTEEYRKIGEGSINSVYWANPKTLVYIDRDLVYRVSANELYTRGLYSNMVGAGNVSGRLPLGFDPRHDSFSVNQKANGLVLIQSDRIVSLFKLDKEGFDYLVPVYSKPVTDTQGTVISIKPFWTAESKCILWINSLGYEDGIVKSSVFSVSDKMNLLDVIPGAGEPVVSDDGKRLCYSQQDSLVVVDLAGWRLSARLDGEKIISYVWNGNDQIFAGGEATVRQWDLTAVTVESGLKVLFLSACNKVFWNGEGAVCAEGVNKGYYDYNFSNGSWSLRDTKPEAVDNSVQNGRYRVFTGTTPNLKYKNTLYVRTLSGKAVTKPLFPDTAVKSEPLKKVSLIVDALDDASGLSRILSVLKKYEVSATFFVNGEFIRRYPKETRQIVKSGFDCGAMFFTNSDLTSKGFVVDEEFIRRGLARNEDEFFALAEKELILLWHAPSYKSTAAIKAAGTACGYRYIEAGRFALDNITLEEAAMGKPGYLSASQMIAFYAENATDGSVIPISAGVSKGSRSDYLYEKLDLLIGSLLNEGYEITDSKSL